MGEIMTNDVDTTPPGTFAKGWNDRLNWKEIPPNSRPDYLDGYRAATRAMTANGNRPFPDNQRFNERVGK